MEDWQLLQEFARSRSEDAFRELVARHAGMVLASATRQGNDGQMAQDIVQAVFLLLARKAARIRPGTRVAGWLFETTRFVTARAMRSEQRRLRREQEAFDMHRLSSTDETWRRMTPIIDEALDRLNRTDRDAILLRYLEGRSLREVSASLGVTEEAGKKRVARAVEKLRQLLGRKGVALTIATMATTLASHAAAATPASLVASLSTNVLAAKVSSTAAVALASDVLAAWRWVKLRWLAGAGISILVLVTGFVATTNYDSRKSAADGASHSTVATAAAPSAGIPLSESMSVPAAIRSPNDSNFKHLKLHVVDADSGEAVSNAPVFLSVWRNESVENRWNLVTDNAGFCDVPYEPDAVTIDVGVLINGWAVRYATWPSEGYSGFPSEHVMRLARVTDSIGGSVRDPQGRPLADVQIWFQGMDNTDYSHRERPRERFGFRFNVPATRTDQNGRWSLSFVPPKNPGFQIEARHPAFADTTLISTRPDRGPYAAEEDRLKPLWNGRLVSTMNAAFTLSGTIVDQQNRPVAGARLQERDDSKISSTDADGNFRVPKLKEGQWSFTVTAEGFAPVRTNALLGPTTPRTLVTLQTGAVLRLRVIDEYGHDVPDAEVGMERWGANLHDFEWREKTDFTGRIEWRSAPRDEELELFARKTGFCYTRNIRVQADGEEHTISLHHTLDVYGRVVDAESDHGIRDFKVLPLYGAPPRFADDFQLSGFASQTVRGTNGLFKLTFTEKQYPWQVGLTADGYDDWTSEPLTNLISTVLDIALKRSRPKNAVRGVVLLPDGSPAAGADVGLLTFEHSVTLQNRSFDGNPRWLAKTGTHGEFSFPTNRLAHSVAAVSHDGYAHLRLRDTGEGLELRLQPWGRVEGVVDESAATHGVSTLHLCDPAADAYRGRVLTLSSYAVKPDANRRFVFEFVPPGEFSVYINSADGIPFHHQTSLVVNPGETTSVVISEWAGTRVTGRLIPPPGQTISWKKELIRASLWADVPPLPQSQGPLNERKWRELDFWTSRAGRDRANTPLFYSVVIRDDGSFVSLERLRPGKYRFTTVFKDASVNRHITISEEQPPEMDLGEVLYNDLSVR